MAGIRPPPALLKAPSIGDEASGEDSPRRPISILAELKRRNVIKVSVAYLALGWLGITGSE